MSTQTTLYNEISRSDISASSKRSLQPAYTSRLHTPPTALAIIQISDACKLHIVRSNERLHKRLCITVSVSSISFPEIEH